MSYIRFPATGANGVTKYATAASLPVSASDGDMGIVLDTDLLYVYNGSSWVIIGGPGAAITVSDTNSVDLTLSANNLTADLRLSAAAADAGNFNAITSIEADGLQVQVANSSVQSAISVSDTNSIDLTYSSGVISSDLKLSASSADPGYFNAAVTIETDGLQVQIANSSIAANFVPYTGATGNVNLGSNTLTVGELIDSGLTANTVPYANGSKQLTSSAVTPTELGYLSGVTSNIQTQLNGKQSTLTTGNLTEATSSVLSITGGTGAVIGSGTTIQVTQSTTSTSGYLSSTDWNTFNNKQTASLLDGKIWIGNGSNVATAVTLTGDVTTTNAGVTAIGANKVTNSQLATVATATFKGRTTAGTGNVEDLTATQATALLNAFVGDSGSGGTKGLVPAPSTGDATKYLKGDGTWATVSGGGGVTWTEVTGTTQTMSVNNGYIANNASQVELTLPATSSVGDTIYIVGKGAGGWNIKSNASASAQTIKDSSETSPTSSSSAISLRISIYAADAITLVCTTANSVWTALSDSGTSQPYIVATGGTITTDGNYKVHSFTSSGTFTITAGSGAVDTLVIAGGGGGGYNAGGGGGAGGYLYTTGSQLGPGTYTVTVGAGGAGATSTSARGSSGNNSSFINGTGTSISLTASGGGGGGTTDVGQRDGGNGGSGGGACANGTGGTGSQGNNGGNSVTSGGGGGGSGAAGTDSTGINSPGNGGNGTSNSITGSAVTYAGGGGGSGDASGNGTGGTGGGGAGGASGTNGTANTGGGGGGSRGGGTGGTGGSGIVIVRYQFQ